MRTISKKSSAFGVAVSLLVVFLMVFCTFSGMAQPDTKESYNIAETDEQITKLGHGYLKVAMQDEPKTINTVIAQDVWDWNVLGWLVDGPINRQKLSRQPFPWMAESWEYNPANPLHATMTLKQGIYWTDHDFDTYGEDLHAGVDITNPDKSGDPAGYREVTASDLVFSYNLVKDAPRYQNALDPLRIDDKGDNDPSNDVLGVVAVDRYTVEYTLVRPTSDLVMDIMSFIIWPEHIWSAHLGDKLTWQPSIDEVVFSGMFILDQWVKGSFVTLKTNPHYFNKSAIPNIDGILFRIYTNTDAAILALESNEVDFIAWTIQPGYIPQIVENPNLEIAQTQEMGFFYTSYNFRNRAFGYDNFNSPDRVDVGKPLRQAIAHCINKEEIVLKLLQGKGTVGDSPVSPANSLYYNTTVRTYPFDPARATAILDANGYQKVGGWYRAPNGDPIDGPGGDGVIDIIHPPADYDPVRAEAARMIADQLTQVGIRAKNTPLDFGSLVQKTNTHDFEMFLLGWSIGGEDAGYLWDFFRSDPRDTVGGYNSPGYRNASYDAIVDQMVEEIDVDRRVELAKWAQGVITEDLAYNVLYYRDNIEAYRTTTYPTGWWRQTGGVFNQWTIMGLRTTPE
ncbi:MAG TPA: ABC transporter substrate-binding protein, partial [Euryarchaeota archaeon]|nr:ABC transporter substrate-binding protein [Euryarchaeota archaeon]